MKNLETTRNVLIGVDIQNDFIDDSLAVKGGIEVVEPFNRTAEVTRKVGGTVILTRDWHPPETPHFKDYGGDWITHCVAGTRGAAFHPDLVVEPTDIVISKGMGQTDGFSGWEGVAADGQTIESIITPQDRAEKVRIFIAGIAIDYCVKATALDVRQAYKTDKRVATYLLQDASRGVEVSPGDTDHALQNMREAGVVIITSADAINMIQED